MSVKKPISAGPHCLVVYSSQTGNTAAVARTIHEIMPPGTDIFPIEEAPAPDAYDFLVLGFWVRRAAPDQLMLDYMDGVRGKVVGLFGTLAA